MIYLILESRGQVRENEFYKIVRTMAPALSCECVFKFHSVLRISEWGANLSSPLFFPFALPFLPM